jgi:glycosyltransferase involved in cell wall biosynthesis
MHEVGMGSRGKRVVIVSMDQLPGRSHVGSGAGVRAWGLGQGLIGRGFSVEFLVPEKKDGASPAAEEYRSYSRKNLESELRSLSPDVAVFQNWGNLAHIRKLDIPMVIDFHGPSIIEMEIMKNPLLWLFKRLKLESIAKADYFTCAGEYQKNYFFAWLVLAGVRVERDPIGVVHVGMPPEMPVWTPSEEITLVHGGHFVPWVDTSDALHDAVGFLEQQGKGRLKVFGGVHPLIQFSDARIDGILDRLGNSPAVDFPGLVPADEVNEHYRRCHVAIDLQKKNPERCLAFTTRTVHYLWCGLPVIYSNYAQLTPYIEKYEAGWILDPEDRAGFRRLLKEIYACPEEIHRRSRNAQRLVAEHLTWDRVIGDLASFCDSPVTREKIASPVTSLGAAKYLQETLWKVKSRIPFTG